MPAFEAEPVVIFRMKLLETNGSAPVKNPRRIAIVIDRIVRWNGAGTEHHIAQLLKSLDRNRYDPAIFVFEPSEHPLPSNLGFPIVVIPPGDPRRHFRLFWNLTSSLRSFQPDIVQIFFRDATYLGPVAAMLTGVPCVVLGRRDVAEPSAWWEFPAMRFVSTISDCWVCNSATVRDWVVSKRWAKPDRITVLPNCVDLDHFHPPSSEERLACRRKLSLPLDAPVMLSVANLRTVKGLETILEAMRLVQHEVRNAKVFLIGEGPERERLQSKIQSLELQETVFLAGAQDDVAPWLMAADMGLLASYREGSSNALLEYLATGLPSVVSAIPANLELVEEVFFPPGDSQSMAHKIVSLWNDVAFRQELSRRYRTSALQYSTEKFTQHINGFYDALLAERC